jgi:hypothetical protein
MRPQFRVLAFFLCFSFVPALFAASRKVVIGEYFTATW